MIKVYMQVLKQIHNSILKRALYCRLQYSVLVE